jgi:Putative addiction module component
MIVDPNELFSLPAAEPLRLVELLWDNLGKSTDPIPLPDWVEAEALRPPQRNDRKPGARIEP